MKREQLIKIHFFVEKINQGPLSKGAALSLWIKLIKLEAHCKLERYKGNGRTYEVETQSYFVDKMDT